MCGIFGVVCRPESQLGSEFLGQVVDRLFRFSETRGREAAGLAVHNGTSIDVLKQAGSVSSFLRSPRYQDLMGKSLGHYDANGNGNGRAPAPLALTGHSRLVTNGFQSNDDNNQPVIARGAVGIHNGIVTNEAALWERYPELQREFGVDSEVLIKVLRHHVDETADPAEAARRTLSEIRGSASVAIFFDDLPYLLLATNTGSLFYVHNETKTFLAFASERFILQRLLESRHFEERAGSCTIRQIKAYEGVLVGLEDLALHPFAIEAERSLSPNGFRPAPERAAVIDHTKRREELRRCTRCILPETYPLIEFDAEGVCDYCRNHRQIEVAGEEALFQAVEKYRSADGSPDVIVAFSGGRDSTYGLHYVKTVLGMNPVAFTYDWGMVTDLARRNQARICGKLGIEHIVRSADIATKRRYIRRNVEAWLRRPELGMVTLFTAGDKEFYHHARQLRRETGIKLVIFCTGNMIEDTPYKTGFCGIKERDHGMTLTGLSKRDKAALLGYYMKQYLLNPAYFNESLWDTLKAFWHTFVVKDDFLYLFHYLKWEEETVVGTILREYEWEVATDTRTTWRIGDGTAAFYNYIYYTMAGWTEDEVMLSNQIREGEFTREEAWERAQDYSQPRYESIREYAQMIGINCEEVLSAINAAPKLY